MLSYKRTQKMGQTCAHMSVHQRNRYLLAEVLHKEYIYIFKKCN